MIYNILEIAEILKMSSNTVRARTYKLKLKPYLLKPNNTHYFTLEQMELIRDNIAFKRQETTFFDRVYYIYESKMNK